MGGGRLWAPGRAGRGLEPNGPDFEPLVKGGGRGELVQLVLAALLYVAVRGCAAPGGGSCGYFVLVILGGVERGAGRCRRKSRCRCLKEGAAGGRLGSRRGSVRDRRGGDKGHRGSCRSRHRR